ncbi:uncharacterized protein LOC141804245 [Halichoeres trimaculatus]|uniref:uncharacterized protein LOC141804245 n=1 Tax=Halichoeres trimaculatus TaxID=147232 RepID=UPI003D9EC8C9
MERLHAFLVVLSVISFSSNWACGSVLVVTVQPGENITLYCDIPRSTGVYIVWYKNCTHKNQPPLVLTTRAGEWKNNANPRFHFVNNQASNSYDLLIQNITESDEGFYYCGTEEQSVEDKECINSKFMKSYGNVTTRIIIKSESGNSSSEGPVHVPWMMIFSPAITIFSTFISITLVFHLWEKMESGSLKKRLNIKVKLSQNQDEDLCLTEVAFWPQDEETHQ